MKIKRLSCAKKLLREITEKICFQEKFAQKKQMLGIEKPFPVININLYNQWNVAAMETFGEFLEAATQRCSYEKVFWKYEANLP